MTNAQKADRLALIIAIAERQKLKAKLSAQSARLMRSEELRDIANERENKAKLAKAKKERKDLVDESFNINQYTDASKYAETYYGETRYFTTKYDNDWN